MSPIGTTWRRPVSGSLATLDAALLVTPPPGLEVDYVPIVTHQSMP